MTLKQSYKLTEAIRLSCIFSVTSTESKEITFEETWTHMTNVLTNWQRSVELKWDEIWRLLNNFTFKILWAKMCGCYCCRCCWRFLILLHCILFEDELKVFVAILVLKAPRFHRFVDEMRLCQILLCTLSEEEKKKF